VKTVARITYTVLMETLNHALCTTCPGQYLSVYARCTDGRKLQIAPVRVVVKAAAVKPKYVVTLGGTTEMVREERDVSHGTAIFRDLLILSMPAEKTSDV